MGVRAYMCVSVCVCLSFCLCVREKEREGDVSNRHLFFIWNFKLLHLRISVQIYNRAAVQLEEEEPVINVTHHDSMC